MTGLLLFGAEGRMGREVAALAAQYGFTLGEKEEAAILAAYRCGAFSSVPLNRSGEAITKMLADLHENDRALLENIEASGNITDTNLDALIGAVKRHLASYC